MPSIGRLLRGSDREFFDLFEEAGANIVRAAALLDELLRDFPETQLLAREILICEHDGDRITHDIIQRLNHTFVTPIDREDILELASGARRHRRLHRGGRRLPRPLQDRGADGAGPAAGPRAACRPRARSPRRCRGCAASRTSRSYTVEINRLENDGDRIVREALAALFDGGIDPMVVIRWKDIFERLEEAIDATETVANMLEGIVIKNA